MTPNEFQKATAETEIYSKAATAFIHKAFLARDIGALQVKEAIQFTSLMYCAGKLNGEAGEVAEEVFKAFRDNGTIDEDRRERILNELGDTMWYVARLSDLLGYPLEYVMETNIDKLMSRKNRGTLSGSGSNR